MGVQLEFVCTVTQNDVVARTIQTGNYAIADHVVKTLANVMDIQVSMFNQKPIHYIIKINKRFINTISLFFAKWSYLKTKEVKEIVWYTKKDWINIFLSNDRFSYA